MQRNNIRTVRKLRGMTREVLAAKAGISIEALFDFENYYKSPTLSELEAIAKALDVSAADLVRGV